MTTYRAITSTEDQVEAFVTAELAQAWTDNHIATAEGAANAPIVAAGWHPFDMVNVGDGATGRVYDSAVSGTVASIVVSFTAGYDYLIRWHGLSPTGVGGAFQINGTAATASISAASTISGSFELSLPTLANHFKFGILNVRNDASGASNGPAGLSGAAATPFFGYFTFSNFGGSIASVTLTFAGVSIDAGKCYVYRRRNYVTG